VGTAAHSYFRPCRRSPWLSPNVAFAGPHPLPRPPRRLPPPPFPSPLFPSLSRFLVLTLAPAPLLSFFQPLPSWGVPARRAGRGYIPPLPGPGRPQPPQPGRAFELIIDTGKIITASDVYAATPSSPETLLATQHDSGAAHPCPASPESTGTSRSCRLRPADLRKRYTRRSSGVDGKKERIGETKRGASTTS